MIASAPVPVEVPGQLINNDRTREPRFLGGNGRLPWPAEHSALFGSGREALYALMTALGVGHGDSVLIPGYVPEGVLAPCLRRGVRVEMYPITEDLSPEWDTLETLLDAKRPRIAVLIHYFGVRQDAARFRALCERFRCIFIEDLAHVLPAEGASIGIEGDVVLYSLPKMLPVSDGAALVLRRADVGKHSLTYRRDPRHELYCCFRRAELALATKARHSRRPAFWLHWRPRFARFLPSYQLLLSFVHRPGPMSGSALRTLAQLDIPAIIRQRMEWEALYHSNLNSDIFQPYASVQGRAWCSIGYPVRVKDRFELVKFLQRCGIQGACFEHRWNYFPEEPGHDAGRRVMREHFLFPTATSLTKEEVQFVITCANLWASMQTHSQAPCGIVAPWK